MRWKTPVFDEKSELYSIYANKKRQKLEDDEREWLLEKNIPHCYTILSGLCISVGTRTITILSFILLPKPLAVEFMLRFGGKS